MSLRGYLLIIPIFILLPTLLGDRGLWLSVPLSEVCTQLLILACALWEKRSLLGKLQ